MMKKGTKTGLFDKNETEIKMGDTVHLYDSDGRTHRIKVGFDFGMFIEDGTGNSLYSVIEPYACYNGGDGVEIIAKKKKVH